MDVTAKERLRRALAHEPVDRIPTQINYTERMGAALAVHFGVAAAELPAFLGNHLVRVDLNHAGALSSDGSERFDWWGCGHDTAEEGYFIRTSPLANTMDLDAIEWPDPHAPGLMDRAAAIMDTFGSDYFIVPNMGFALFERAWALRGLQAFLMDMVLNPEFVEALLDRITEIQLVLIHRYLELGVDGGYFGDDYGAQKSMLFSPVMWRERMKPRMARLFAPFRERGLPVLLHSDGQVQAILPDLVEIGLTGLNPVQPEVLPHEWLQTEFGGRLAFYGGISTQTVLPQGTPADVEQAVAQVAATLAPAGTGLLIAPSHRMMTDVPMANVEAMLAGFRRLTL
jgi:uroporphyrinogen decarboxylase